MPFTFTTLGAANNYWNTTLVPEYNKLWQMLNKLQNLPSSSYFNPQEFLDALNNYDELGQQFLKAINNIVTNDTNNKNYYDTSSKQLTNDIQRFATEFLDSLFKKLVDEIKKSPLYLNQLNNIMLYQKYGKNLMAILASNHAVNNIELSQLLNKNIDTIFKMTSTTIKELNFHEKFISHFAELLQNEDTLEKSKKFIHEFIEGKKQLLTLMQQFYGEDNSLIIATQQNLEGISTKMEREVKAYKQQQPNTDEGSLFIEPYSDAFSLVSGQPLATDTPSSFAVIALSQHTGVDVDLSDQAIINAATGCFTTCQAAQTYWNNTVNLAYHKLKQDINSPNRDADYNLLMTQLAGYVTLTQDYLSRLQKLKNKQYIQNGLEKVNEDITLFVASISERLESAIMQQINNDPFDGNIFQIIALYQQYQNRLINILNKIDNKASLEKAATVDNSIYNFLQTCFNNIQEKVNQQYPTDDVKKSMSEQHKTVITKQFKCAAQFICHDAIAKNNALIKSNRLDAAQKEKQFFKNRMQVLHQANQQTGGLAKTILLASFTGTLKNIDASLEKAEKDEAEAAAAHQNILALAETELLPFSPIHSSLPQIYTPQAQQQSPAAVKATTYSSPALSVGASAPPPCPDGYHDDDKMDVDNTSTLPPLFSDTSTDPATTNQQSSNPSSFWYKPTGDQTSDDALLNACSANIK